MIKTPPKKNKALQDLVILAVSVTLIYVLTFMVKPFEHFIEWSGRHTNWHLDELLIILPIAFGVFAWRRWREIKKEIAERRQAEEAFQDTYANLQAVIQASPLAILAIDPEGKVTLWNPAGERIFGWKAAEALGRPNPIVPADKQEEFRGLGERVLRGESITGLELRRLKKDGSFIDISLSTAPIYDLTDSANRRTIVGTMSVIADITEHKRAEKALRESESKYRNLVKNIEEKHFLYTHDVNGIFIYLSPSITKILGYSPEEFLTHYTQYLTDNPINKEVVRHTELSIQGVKQPPYEVELYHKNGTIRWLEVSETPVFDHEGKVTAVQGIARDITERKQAEEALRNSEERFRAVAQSASDAIISADSQGNIISWNQGAQNIFGYEETEVWGQSLTILMPERHRETHRQGMERLYATGEARIIGKTMELDGLRKDGAEFPLELSLAIWKVGGEIYYSGIIRDITERRGAEEALRNSEERYRLLFESNPQPMWVYDQETLAFLAVNDAAIQHYGFSRDEFLSMTIKDIRPPEDVPELLERVAKREPGISVEGRRRYRKKNGTIVFAETSSSGILFDQRPARLVLAKEITERLKAEEALMESEERYRLLFQRSPVGIFLYNMQLCLTDFNDYFVNLLQSSRERLLGLDMNILKDRSVLPAIEKAIVGEEGFYEGFYRATSGPAEVWVSMRTAPRFDHEGKVKGGVGIVEDVTERKQLEAQLRQSQKMEAVGTLAGGVAHDFNNLLTAVMLNLHSAKSKSRGGFSAESNLEEIENISQRAVQLIRQLLAFSRRQLIHPLPLNLNNILTNMSEMLSRLLHEHIELELSLEGKLGTVKADSSQMEQVIINLCVNARDAMPKGGKLILKTQNIFLDEVYIKQHPWAQKGDYVELEIADTGEGMDEATLGRIFEPFFTTKEAGMGTGLGLSTVYGIIKQHQGYINVYSQPGMGSIFKIYLPRTEEKAAVEAAPETLPIVGGKETILLAEDEVPLQEAIQQILTMYGYTVLLAKDGQEAVNLYEREKERIDLVILDVVMPRMGGKEAAERIYKQNPRQKILFSSGYAAEGLHESFVVPPEMHFIQKPYQAGALAQKIREVLES